ncbi:MAG: MogA/MoaB family molybdenum cofactor biosynthesis protein [Isosphaeraceae bacterium]|nr:MogA/MoaB family molybdenum cofactor biosynthesis protein [Isosphaeraceae bacterium]
MSQSADEHRSKGPRRLALAVVTISDTRTLETDTSGASIVELAEAAGHRIVERELVPDEPEAIRRLLASYAMRDDLHAALLTGGTGIAPRDQTHETVSALLTKPIPGYGELFRMLSFQEIGAAAMLSRAVGGLMGRLVVLVMPGSRGAVNLAMNRLILPELPHLVFEASKS